MMQYTTLYWIGLLAAAVLGMAEVGTWWRARCAARRELAQRGWVCIDLPSPDTVYEGYHPGSRRQHAIVQYVPALAIAAYTIAVVITATLMAIC